MPGKIAKINKKCPRCKSDSVQYACKCKKLCPSRICQGK